MKTFSYRNMPDLGICPLTGEADVFGRRILCDLDEDGVRLMTEYLGLKDNAFPENWNSRVGRKEAVASMMLDRNSFTDIIVFYCLMQGWQYVIVREGDMNQVTVTDKESEMEAWRDLNDPQIRILFNMRPSTPQVGSRNIHQMSGRYL